MCYSDTSSPSTSSTKVKLGCHTSISLSKIYQDFKIFPICGTTEPKNQSNFWLASVRKKCYKYSGPVSMHDQYNSFFQNFLKILKFFPKFRQNFSDFLYKKFLRKNVGNFYPNYRKIFSEFRNYQQSRKRPRRTQFYGTRRKFSVNFFRRFLAEKNFSNSPLNCLIVS